MLFVINIDIYDKDIFPYIFRYNYYFTKKSLFYFGEKKQYFSL